MGIRKYLNNQYWNIGFADFTPGELLKTRKLPKITWMKHGFRDRFFADPFILKADDDSIEILAEEYIFWEKGTIVWLRVDRKTYRLLDRKQILALPTHLSYPVIFEDTGRVFIMPENGESGKLTVYEYFPETVSVKPVRVVSDESLADATPFTSVDGNNYLLATKQPNAQSGSYLYKYDKGSGKYLSVFNETVVDGPGQSRMGGAFFSAGGRLYRPAQDCTRGYGKALTIFEVTSIEPEYKEKRLFRLEPQSWRYNLGMHTLNFHQKSGLSVVDSYGYLYPLIGRVLMAVHNVKQLFYGR